MRCNGDRVEIEIVFGQGVDGSGSGERGGGGGGKGGGGGGGGGGHGYSDATQLDLAERLPAVVGGKRLMNGGGSGGWCVVKIRGWVHGRPPVSCRGGQTDQQRTGGQFRVQF